MKINRARCLLFILAISGFFCDEAFSRGQHQRPNRSSGSSAETESIRDADFSFEKNRSERQVKQQEGIKVLEQANKIDQKPLRLSERSLHLGKYKTSEPVIHRKSVVFGFYP
jgi:hypothetical protein